jgi:outer membrane receptor protein involved in Fe transport
VYDASVSADTKEISSNTNGLLIVPLPPGRYEVDLDSIKYDAQKIKRFIDTVVQVVSPDNRSKDEATRWEEAPIAEDEEATATTNNQLVYAIRKANAVLSGTAGEQITNSIDRSATEIVRRIAGVTMQDGFISIRGMTPRYNPVYLNNASLPSADADKRAFNFDLLPSGAIDRIIIYKTAAPELPGDFAGGVVKIYTKKALPLKRLEISVNGQYRTGNHFFDNHATTGSGKYDWLGQDDGRRQLPANMPRDEYGQIIARTIDNTPNTYTRTNEVLARSLVARGAQTWNVSTVYYPADVLVNLNGAHYINLGKRRLNSVTIGRYEQQRSYFKSAMATGANRFKDTVFPADGTPLTPDYDMNYRMGYDSVYRQNVRLALLQQFVLTFNKNNDLAVAGLFNRNTNSALQLNTLTEFMAGDRNNFFPRRIDVTYNSQELLQVQVSGNHKMGDERNTLEWQTGYAEAGFNDPNQFTNVYEVDDASINHYFDNPGIDKGAVNITDNSLWRLRGATTGNTIIGRLTDAEGREKRWQASLDYTFHPVKKWNAFFIKAGGYFEDRKRNYTMSTLALKDYPEMNWEKEPWLYIGDSLAAKPDAPGGQPMHLEIQDAGAGIDQTNGFRATFRNTAGYAAVNIPLSFTWPFGKHHTMKLDLYGGVRLEHSQGSVNGIGEAVTANQAAASSQLLPSVTASWHLTPVHQLRLAYAKTLNRPELRELSPLVTYSPAKGFTYEGQPGLQNAHINNYDLRWEYYPHAGEIIAAGIYYKKANAPVEEINKDLVMGIPGFGADNLNYATVKGAELEVYKLLNFIPGNLFRYTGVIVNASYNVTETNNNLPPNGSGITGYYPGGATRAFIGAAPWSVNAGLFYDNKNTGSRMSLQYNGTGDRLLTNTGSGVEKAPAVFERGRSVLDVSLLQQLTSWVSIRVAAQNLLNAPIRWYVDGDFNRKYNTQPAQFTKTTYNTATDPPVVSAYIQGDYYLRDYKPGVYYTLGFQFNLQSKKDTK